MSEELEAQFDNAMLNVYRRELAECDYKATRFLHMLPNIAGLRRPGLCCMLEGL